MRDNKNSTTRLEAGKAMRETLLASITETEQMLNLIRNCRPSVVTPDILQRIRAKFAALELRLERMDRRMIAALLIDLLWRYLDYCKGFKQEPHVRVLLSELTRRE